MLHMFNMHPVSKVVIEILLREIEGVKGTMCLRLPVKPWTQINMSFISLVLSIYIHKFPPLCLCLTSVELMSTLNPFIA
jgi:hypothetical protein